MFSGMQERQGGGEKKNEDMLLVEGESKFDGESDSGDSTKWESRDTDYTEQHKTSMLTLGHI